MIPIKLSLRNFMCYRETPVISFESMHTACISGNNGHGKSALIDAITWALWGQSRANSDDDLVHAGQSEIEVQFEFAVGRERYRIIRRHSLPKSQKTSGQTILELNLFTPEGYKVLSGDTVTQTQQKIIRLLHMDYDTFINSAFLRQGHADEFTRKRPSERKQVLANILQLSVYDELEEGARQLSRERENEVAQLDAALRGMADELARKDQCRSDLEKAESDLSAAVILTAGQEKRLGALRQEKEALENKKTQLAEINAHIQDTRRNFNLWQEQAQQHQARIKSYEDLIARRAPIEEGFSRMIEARRQCQELDGKLKQVNNLNQIKHRLDVAIVRAGEELRRLHAVAENRIHELETVSLKLAPSQEELKAVLTQLRELDDFEAGLQEKRERSKEIRARIQLLQSEKGRLEQDLSEIDEKLKMLSHPEGAKCPLCESELGIEGQKRIEAKYRAEGASKRETLQSGQAETARKESELKALESEISLGETKLKRGREAAQSKHGLLSQVISSAREAGERIEGEKQELAGIEQRLALREYAQEDQAALAKVENELKTAAYDPQQHELLRSQVSGLEQYEAPRRKLEEADRQIVLEKEAEARAAAAAGELKARLEADQARQVSLSAEIAAAAGVSAELAGAEAEYQSALAGQRKVQEQIGGIKARLERLADLEIKAREKEAQRTEASRQDKIYKDLAQAFGKKGIQAMLIETAIPEIENEANVLLARMTDNRMNIKLETQRESKKGDILETLDIKISDELGTRNYEMFSGGEAFRIDFAIRIGLSRLLARRAGAPLPTLIIDEGFGTQDSTGIEKIKEAITSIQDDFEKILVITHIADFKDAFPMRIEVVKTPDGSSLSLI